MTSATFDTENDSPVQVLIVISCYRAARLTIDCLHSLRGEIASTPGVKVAICENGSGDDTAEQLAATIRQEGWQDWVGLKVVEPNRGFSAGNNAIIGEAMNWPCPPRYFLLLNSDTIVQPGALRAMLNAIEARPDVGIVSPRLESPNGRSQTSCFRFPSPISEFLEAARTGPVTRLFRHYEVPISPNGLAIEPHWTSFACVLIRREVIAQVGLLDEGFFLYFDDPDYCWRTRRSGWGILHCPAACVVHLVGQSNPVVSLSALHRRRPRYYYESRARFFGKHFGVLGLWLSNVLWTAGRAISLLRETVGHKAPHTCEKEWRDIWSNSLHPLTGHNPPGPDGYWVSMNRKQVSSNLDPAMSTP